MYYYPNVNVIAPLNLQKIYFPSMRLNSHVPIKLTYLEALMKNMKSPYHM